MSSVLYLPGPRRASGIGAAVAAVAIAAHAHAADLSVRIANIADDQGALYLSLFDTELGFPMGVRHGQQIPASLRNKDGSMRAVFADLPPGRYAISVFHDRDGNGKLSVNLMGLPSEPYAFSNEVRGAFGPPRFEDAAFDVPAEGASVSLSVK